MKQYSIYKCDYCDFEDKDRNIVEEHEACHLGITVQDMRDYNALKTLHHYLHSLKTICFSDQIVRECEHVSKELKEFETEHSIYIK